MPHDDTHGETAIDFNNESQALPFVSCLLDGTHSFAVPNHTPMGLSLRTIKANHLDGSNSSYNTFATLTTTSPFQPSSAMISAKPFGDAPASKQESFTPRVITGAAPFHDFEKSPSSIDLCREAPRLELDVRNGHEIQSVFASGNNMHNKSFSLDTKNKRSSRRVWSHALEKYLFTSHEMYVGHNSCHRSFELILPFSDPLSLCPTGELSISLLSKLILIDCIVK